MHPFFSRISQHLPTFIGIGFLALIFSFVGAFTSPSQNPPGGNVSPPVTTDTAQTITGLKTFNPAGLFPFALGVGNTGVVGNLNSDRLDSLNAADILAQSAAGSAVTVWGTSSCPSGWIAAYTGEARVPLSAMYAGSFGGTGAGTPICVAAGGENIRQQGNESFSAIYLWWATGKDPPNSSTIEYDDRRLSCALCVK